MQPKYKIRYNEDFEDFDVYRLGVRKLSFSSVPHAIEFVKRDSDYRGEGDDPEIEFEV